MALNLPGPAACSRLRDLGASVVKVEPPRGDPMEMYCPAWYARLHDDVTVKKLDLKEDADRRAMDELLLGADLFVTAQRPSALARLGLGAGALAERFPKLCHVAITGHPPPDEEVPGHDLTYLAQAGILTPPALPATLYADMAGAERAVSTALALIIARDRRRPSQAAYVPLSDAADWLALPRDYGLTKPGAMVGGALASYNIYAAKRGWVAVAALEPHFAAALAEAFGFERLTVDRAAAVFATEDAEHWETWARPRDLPIVALRTASLPES